MKPYTVLAFMQLNAPFIAWAAISYQESLRVAKEKSTNEPNVFFTITESNEGGIAAKENTSPVSIFFGGREYKVVQE